jgi:hypothetical protein
MFEYVAFNPYNASPEAMASELTKKSSDGWEVATQQTQSVAEATTTTVASAQTSATVPAAWYADPSGRFELRYWNGKEWTEHVARSGQQFTDPPVA